MQSRQDVQHLNLLTINRGAHQADSFFLFNFLTLSPARALAADTIYSDDDVNFKLSHGLTYVRLLTNEDEIMVSYYQLDDNQGKLYLLPTGICYYQTPHPMHVDNLSRDAITQYVEKLLVKENELHSKSTQFETPLSLALLSIQLENNHLLEVSSKTCQKEVLFLYHRLLYLENHMSALKRWQAHPILENNLRRPYASPVFANFLCASQGIYSFHPFYRYPFQGYQLQFTRPYIKRFRKAKQDYTLEILAEKPFYCSGSMGMFHVKSLFEASEKKTEPKHPRIFIIDTKNNLRDRHRGNKKYAPKKHAKGYQHGISCERYIGPDLIRYANQKLMPLRDNAKHGAAFLTSLLKISWLCYEELHTAMHGDIHGDIKPGNILINESSNEMEICLTDFESIAKFTPLYASPERFTNEAITPKSDVYSMARGLVYLFGDAHVIWRLNENNRINNCKVADIILENHPDGLLESFFKKLKALMAPLSDAQNVYNRLCDFFKKAHSHDPSVRPTAEEASQIFKQLYLDVSASLEIAEKVNAGASTSLQLRRAGI